MENKNNKISKYIYLIGLIFSILLISGETQAQTVKDNFAGWANVLTNPIMFSGNYKFRISGFQGNPKAFDQQYILTDIAVGDVLWSNTCSRFIVVSRTLDTIVVSDPDPGLSVLPTAGERIGLTREFDYNGSKISTTPQFGDGAGGPILGTTASLGACISAHNLKVLSATHEISKYTGSGVPAFTPTGTEPRIAQGLASPYPFYLHNGSTWSLIGSGGGSVDTSFGKIQTHRKSNAMYVKYADKGIGITNSADTAITVGLAYGVLNPQTAPLGTDEVAVFDGTTYKRTPIGNIRLDSISSNSGYLYFSQSLVNVRNPRVLDLSDSRGDNGHLSKNLRDSLISIKGDGGVGIVNIGTDYPLFGTVSPTVSGTTQLSNTGLALNHPVGYARQFAQNDYWQTTTVPLRYGKFDTVTIYYPIQAGAITYQVNIDGSSAGSFTTTTGGSGVGSATISGFANAAHILRITQTSTGTGVLFDADLKSSDAGIRWAKYAHTGISPATVAGYANAGNFSYFTSNNAVDLTIIRLGVNGANSTPAKTAGVYIDSIAAKSKLYSPRSDVIILGEPDNNDSNDGGATFLSKRYIDGYNYIYDSLAYAKGYGFISLKDVASNWTYFSKAIGTTDLLHENNLGGLYYAKHVMKNIFNSTPKQNYLSQKYNTIYTLIDSTLILNGISNTGIRKISFRTNNGENANINYTASSGLFQIKNGSTFGFGNKLDFVSDGRSRFYASSLDNLYWTGSGGHYFYKPDTTVAFSWSPSAFAANTDAFTISGSNPTVNISASGTSNSVLNIGSDRAQIKHLKSNGTLTIGAGRTSTWNGKLHFEIDSFVRAKITGAGGFVINFDTMSNVDPLTIKGIKTGSTTDSIGTIGTGGVLRRLSIAQVNAMATNNLSTGANTDSLMVVSGGLPRRVTALNVVNKVFSDSCRTGIGAIGTIAAMTTDSLIFNFGYTLGAPPQVLITVESVGAAPVFSWIGTTSTGTGFTAYVRNTDAVVSATSVKIHWRACPNAGSGY